MTVQPGSRLGAYEILSLQGAGGMGEVYKARDTRLGRIVAIKVIGAASAEDPAMHARFEREARAISSLDHPNICALYDVGEEAGLRYLVMQYLEGIALSTRLTQDPLPLAEAVRYAIDIARALDAAHVRGIVHRDLKPGNVMLWGNYAMALEWSGQNEAARKAYQRAAALAEASLRVNAKEASVQMSLAEYYAALGDRTRATTLMRSALALEPDNPRLHYQAAVLEEHHLGNREDALKWLRSAIDKGYSRQQIARSPSLAALREDPRFQDLQ